MKLIKMFYAGFFLFFFSLSAFSHSESIIIVNVSGLGYNPETETVEFVLEFKPGANYGDYGRFSAGDVRFNAYLEPGVELSIPEGVFVPSMNKGFYNGNLRGSVAATQIKPDVPEGFTGVAIGLGILRPMDIPGIVGDIGDLDAKDNFTVVGRISIPLAAGSKIPTNKSYLVLRTEPYYEMTGHSSYFSTHSAMAEQAFITEGVNKFIFSYNRWTGEIDSDWNNPNNWTEKEVPADGKILVIDEDAVHAPSLDKNRIVGAIVNESNKDIYLNGHTLEVTGSISLAGGGKIDVNIPGSTLVLAGGNDTSQPLSVLKNNTADNLNIKNPSTNELPNNLTVTGTLTLDGDDLSLNGNTLTLGSNVAGSKKLDATDGTLVLGGNKAGLEIPALVDDEVENLTLSNNSTQFTVNTTGGELEVTGTLAITSGAKGIMVEAGKLLQAGNTTNTGGNGALVIAADPATNISGSFITGQGNVVPATVWFYPIGNQDAASDISDTQVMTWQYFGSPVEGFASTAANMANAFVRRYDGNDKKDEDRNNPYWFDHTAVLEPGRGYEISAESSVAEDIKILFKGNLVTGNKTQTFNTSPLGIAPSQWVFSNPFVGALDLGDGGVVFDSNMDQTIYVLNTGSSEQWSQHGENKTGGNAPGQYSVFVPNTTGGRIPPMQGFIARRVDINAPGSITMNYSGIKRSTNALRSASAQPEKCFTDILLFSNNDLQDRMSFYTDARATSGYDNGYDGKKMPGGSRDYANIYSLGSEKGQYFHIDASDDINQSQIVIKAAKGIQNYTLRFNHHNLASNYDRLFLVDLETGTRTEVTADGSEYNFIVTADYKAENIRFQLRSESGTTGLTQTSADKSLVVYQSESNMVVANNNTEFATADITVYDISGVIVDRFTLDSLSSRIVSLSSFSSGVYTVMMILPDGTGYTEKVIK